MFKKALTPFDRATREQRGSSGNGVWLADVLGERHYQQILYYIIRYNDFAGPCAQGVFDSLDGLCRYSVV